MVDKALTGMIGKWQLRERSHAFCLTGSRSATPFSRQPTEGRQCIAILLTKRHGGTHRHHQASRVRQAVANRDIPVHVNRHATRDVDFHILQFRYESSDRVIRSQDASFKENQRRHTGNGFGIRVETIQCADIDRSVRLKIHYTSCIQMDHLSFSNHHCDEIRHFFIIHELLHRRPDGCEALGIKT